VLWKRSEAQATHADDQPFHGMEECDQMAQINQKAQYLAQEQHWDDHDETSSQAMALQDLADLEDIRVAHQIFIVQSKTTEIDRCQRLIAPSAQNQTFHEQISNCC
jgi:hypothetical protein